MIAETSTWRVGDGWQPGAPTPGEGTSVLVVMGDRDAVEQARATGVDPIGDLRAAWSGRPVLGFSTAGQAVGDVLLEGAIVATVLHFARTEVRSATTSLTASGSARRAGRVIAQALASPDLRFVLFAADGIRMNGSGLADGISDVLGGNGTADGPFRTDGLDGVDMVGVLAADGARYEHAWTFGADGIPSDSSITALGFAGDALEITHATGGGWHPLGPERLVTASHGNVVRELDGEPPAALFLDYLGDLANDGPELIANCSMLPVEIRDLDDRRSVRTVRQVHADGSVSVSGDVPQGAGARLLRTGVADLLHDATVTAKAARQEDAEWCLVVSAAGRRRVLGGRVEDEVSAVLQELPAGTPTIACWSYGTVHRDHERADVDDQTICITTLRERPELSTDGPAATQTAATQTAATQTAATQTAAKES